MKRLAVLLLALCLLGGSAQAQGLRVLGMSLSGGPYQEAYPEYQVEEIPIDFDEMGRFHTQRFLLDNPQGWDVACIWSNECDLDALAEAGLLMDLSGDSTLAQWAADLHAPIRRAVSRDDQVLAVPTFLFGAVMQMTMVTATQPRQGNKDLLGPLGLTQADAPTTFEELCAMAQRYAALPKEIRKGRTFQYDATTGNPKAYFLAYLIELYTAQYSDKQGYVVYDTPTFRQALADLEKMAAALQKDPKLSYSGKEPIYPLFADGGPCVLPTMDYQHFLYLGVGDNRNIPARLEMLVVNPHTQSKAEAIDFVIRSIRNAEAQAGPMLLERFDYDALARRSYDENIEAQIYQKEAQAVIDGLIRERDSGEYPRYYSREAIQRYAQNVVPFLTFPRIPRVDRYALAEEYVRGRLDGEGLMEALGSEAERYWGE